LKQNLKEAAQLGDLVRFARYWNTRVAIGKRRIAWKPILEEQKLKQDAHNKILGLQAMQAVNAQANALMMKGGASFAEAAMGDNGMRYGNATVGLLRCGITRGILMCVSRLVWAIFQLLERALQWRSIMPVPCPMFLVLAALHRIARFSSRDFRQTSKLGWRSSKNLKSRC
jgi:hypothetical protein